MTLRIEDYALIGDTQTAALVGIDGSIDWLCLPRFDAGACFAALLGGPEHGRWSLAPAAGEEIVARRRRYRGRSLVLETEFETRGGLVRVVDCMPPRQVDPDLVRVVEGVRGTVRMAMDLVIRFDYGRTVPWVRRIGQGISAVAGPDALVLATPVPLRGQDFRTVAEFTVREGESVPFVLVWHPSHTGLPRPVDGPRAVADTEAWWHEWSARSSHPFRPPPGAEERWSEAVYRSLITLKALTYEPTGGLVAAPTTSLPEWLGGVRNWDYRYCWLRDATFSLYSLMLAGHVDEAIAWRDWLLRAVAGDPSQLQIMYGCAGERRLPEFEVPWLPGYGGSQPVRIGNAASEQLQLDVYGEVLDALHGCRRAGISTSAPEWALELALVEFLEGAWRQPDEGLWEVRGPRRQFTHSKVMAWVAFDRAVKAVESFGLEGPVDRWRAARDEVHAEVLREAYDPDRSTFTQSYGARELDAALLMIPLVGFLPHDDPRVRGTTAAIEAELTTPAGFVLRYRPDGAGSVDGLPAGEGCFLACTFWLVDNLALQGRRAEAVARFDALLDVANDVGLLAEEYDSAGGRLLGNFPQAFSHVALVNSAWNLAGTGPPGPRGAPDGRPAPGASPT